MHWVQIYLGVLFHPMSAFSRIKHYRDRLSYFPICVMLFLVIAVRVAYIYITHFPLAEINQEETNIILEMLKYIVPVISWGIVSFAVTSIWEGESFLKECIAGATVAMTPYVILAIPIGLLSRILEIDQSGLFNFLNTVMFIWIALLLFIGIMTMNDYGFTQAIKVSAVCLVGIVLLWAIFLLLATLTYQLFDFVKKIIVEIRMRIV